MSVELSDHEKKLMEDFAKRAKGMRPLNLFAGLAGVAVAFAAFPGSWLSSLLAALSGGLIGVSLEKRYLGEMRAILLKLWEQHRPPS